MCQLLILRFQNQLIILCTAFSTATKGNYPLIASIELLVLGVGLNFVGPMFLRNGVLE